MYRLQPRPSSNEAYLRRLEVPPDHQLRSAQFYHNLKSFYRRRWNVDFTRPHIMGVEVDLFMLYDLVSSMGGWQRVTSLEKWNEVALEVLGTADDTVGADLCVKLMYMRFLSRFEQFESVGDVDDHEPELSSRNRVRGFSLYVTSECPVSSQRKDPNVEIGLGYDRLVKSLASGLPNEVDFCLNLCTLLSSPGPNVLQLENASDLLTLLVAQAGIFDDNSSNLKDIVSKMHKDVGLDFDMFWSNMGISDPEVLNLLPGVTDPSVSKLEASLFPALKEVNMDEKKSSTMAFRVNQVLNIVRNLSFEEPNRPFMTESSPVVKLLIVGIVCEDIGIRNSALDALGELAPHLNMKEDFMTGYAYILLRHLRSFLFSHDRFLLIRAAETAGGLCGRSENEVILTEFFDADVLERIRDLMTVQDLLVCNHVLDALYNVSDCQRVPNALQMSETGKGICDRICATPRLVNLLVDFTTIEAPKFGAIGLQGVKIVESYEDNEPRSSYQYGYRQAPGVGPGPSHGVRVVPQVQQLPPSAIRPHVVVNSKGDYSVPLPKSALSAQLAKPTEMTSEMRVEHFSKIWIRQHCQADAKCSVDRGDLYATYVQHFRNTHKILSCSMQNFCKFIQDIFPHVEIKGGQLPRSTVVEGIRFLKPSAKGPMVSSVVNSSASESNENIAPAKTPKEEDRTINNHEIEVSFEVCPAPTEAGLSIPASETKILRVENSAAIEKTNGVTPIVGKPHALNGSSESRKLVNGECNGVSEPMPNGNGTVKQNGDETESIGSVDHEEVVETSIDKDDELEAEEQVVLNGKERVEEDLEAEEEEEKSVDAVEDNSNSESNNTIPPHKPIKLNGSLKGKKRSHPAEANGTSPAAKRVNGVEVAPKPEEPAKTEATDDSEEPSTSSTPPPALNRPAPQFMCEWDACTRLCHSGSAMIYHIQQEHLSDAGVSYCRWPGCERTQRVKWSLITHLQDHHCNDSNLNAALRKRKELGEAVYIAQLKKTLETETPAANHPGYSRYAAYDAIRRHAFNYLTKEITDEPEGPVTKSLRLTSCLILRNLARNSLDARRQIRSFEGFLSYLAMSRLESSVALAQCLAAINNAEA